MITAIYNYPFPVFTINDDFILREQTLEDVEPFFDYYSDADVANYILAKTPQTLKDAKEEIEYCKKLFKHRLGIYWAIARKSDNKMIGAIGLYINNHHHRAEISYDLNKAFWRKGIMTKAMNIVMEHMFRYGGLHRIEAVTIKENDASTQLLEKLGFHREGTLSNYRYYNNKPHNVEIFAITKKGLNEAKSEVKSDA